MTMTKKLAAAASSRFLHTLNKVVSEEELLNLVGQLRDGKVTYSLRRGCHAFWVIHPEGDEERFTVSFHCFI